MKAFMTYLFWPNPAGWYYTTDRVQMVIGLCVVLVVLSFVVRVWRRYTRNPVTNKLTRSWPSALFWFGLVGLLLVVCRVEMIQFLAMRVLWGVWAASFILFVLFQLMSFRRRHYTVLARTQVVDERDKYLPRRK